jgi:hypothetical protein
MIAPISTEKQALTQNVRACFDPIAALHLSEHSLGSRLNQVHQVTTAAM